MVYYGSSSQRYPLVRVLRTTWGNLTEKYDTSVIQNYRQTAYNTRFITITSGGQHRLYCEQCYGEKLE